MATYNLPKAQCWSNEPIPFIATPRFSLLSSFSIFSDANKNAPKIIFVTFVIFEIFGI